MADKRLIYFTTQRVTAYLWKGGHLEAERIFAANDEGVAAFGLYVAEYPKSLFYLLADLVEEDFTQESIPAVGGKDRETVIKRKIAQRYRDTSLATALSLGVSKVGGRREESLLFASFSNTQPFQPWLSVLRSHEARLVGVYSTPLVAPLLAKRIGFKGPNFLMVSLSAAGLRQTYVEGGQLRLSRLGHADQSDPRALAQLCAQESSRLQQYMVNLRIIARDAGILDVIVLSPAGQKAHFEAACRSTAALQFHIHSLDEVSKPAGLKTQPENSGSEALFLHTLAAGQPSGQFASDELRRYYNVWRARLAVMGAGIAICAFCLLLAALKLGETFLENREADAERQKEALAVSQYASIQATFPKTPTDSAKLGLIVKNYQSLLTQAATPEQILVDISRALADLPQIELENIEWDATGSGPASQRDQASKPPPGGAPAGAAPATAGPKQSAALSGRINLPQSNDYRAITEIVDQFVAALRKQPGIEVISRRLPFDITAEKSLAGDIGTQRAAEIPRFTVVIVRRSAT